MQEQHFVKWLIRKKPYTSVMLKVCSFLKKSVNHIYLTTYTLKNAHILFDVFYRWTMCVVNNRVMAASVILKLFSIIGK